MVDRVAVVGAGAVGTTLAGDLADRGVSVTLFEREAVGSGASGRAAGVVYDAYTDRRDVALAQRSLERFRETTAFEAVPYVVLARGETTDGPAVEHLATRMADRGVAAAYVDGTTLADRFPALATDGVTGAAVVENAGVVDPDAYLGETIHRARAAGVTVETDTAVELVGPRTVGRVARGGTTTFDTVVVAAGAATATLVAAVGVGLPLGHYRAQLLQTESVAASPPTVYDATGEYYFRPRDGGVLVGDGVDPSATPAAWDAETDAAFRRQSRGRLAEALGSAPETRTSWAGLCTATPDGVPMVGAVADGLYVATGFHGHGLLRAPAVAERLAVQVLGGEGISGFDPQRFDGNESPALPD